jgi:hypothetical protein
MSIKLLYAWMPRLCSMVLGESFHQIRKPGSRFTRTRRLGFNPLLTLHSSFSTVLLDILGKSNTVGVEDNGMLLPCAKTYKDLEHQRDIHDEVLTNLSVTHPVGAQLGRFLLQRSCAFFEFMITALDNVWSEYVSRGGDIQPAEAFLVFCAIMRNFLGSPERFVSMGLLLYNKSPWLRGSALPGGMSFKPTGRWHTYFRLALNSTRLSCQCS